MDDAEAFLDTLNQENMENRVFSIIKSSQVKKLEEKMEQLDTEMNLARNRGVLEHNSNYQELKKNYSIPNLNNAIDDILARYHGNKKSEIDKLMFDSLKNHLNQASVLRMTDIHEYEIELVKVEKQLFEKELFNDSAMSMEFMCEKYNEVLEKACLDEIKQHDIVLSTCIASRMKAISEVNIEQLIGT